jgi:hypothetical protein
MSVRRPVRLVVEEPAVGNLPPRTSGGGDDEDGGDARIDRAHGEKADPLLIRREALLEQAVRRVCVEDAYRRGSRRPGGDFHPNPNDPATITNLPFDDDGNLIDARSRPRGAGFGVATDYQAARSVQFQARFSF